MKSNRIAVVLLLALLFGCSEKPQTTGDKEKMSVTIMTFNVQNLFDNVDDPGKDDKAYLPLAAKRGDDHIEACKEIEVDKWRDECLNLDWNNDTLAHKLTVLADTIRRVNNGHGPDIVAIQEVENSRILDRLRSDFLTDLNYQPAVLIEGTDARGIDVGFLTRLPLADEPKLRYASFDNFPERVGDTRGVLEATFELPNGELLTGFAVHFPAPFHPTAMRETAYLHLAKLRDALPGNRHAFAAGDFNTTSTEDIKTRLLQRLARPYWTIAHELGCGDCRGTYYYARDDNWSFLDMLLFSPDRSENTTWEIRADSVQVANEFAAQIRADGTPAAYSATDSGGVSDHWPLVMTIELTQKQ